MKIAVSGKGGVGKTTFSSLLIRTLNDQGKKVLAIDADPDDARNLYNVACVYALKNDKDAAFAWLAMRSMNAEPGNSPEVTGASRAAVLGALHRAR